jgi:hypothetical protein
LTTTPTASRHAEIARRYDRKRDIERVSIAALRVADLQRLFFARYGRLLPDDDAGRDDAFIMAQHLAKRPNSERRILAWLSLNCPWMNQADVQKLTAKAINKPIRWRADKLAKRLNLMEAERQRLGITTIGAVDLDQAQRTKRRKEAKRQAMAAARRAKGATPRAEYEAKSVSRAKPWEALGISRRTWYRRHGEPTRGTSPCTA